jgi:hypothetical protein
MAANRSCLINLRNATTRPMGPAIEAGLTLPFGAAKAYMRQLLVFSTAVNPKSVIALRRIAEITRKRPYDFQSCSMRTLVRDLRPG